MAELRSEDGEEVYLEHPIFDLVLGVLLVLLIGMLFMSLFGESLEDNLPIQNDDATVREVPSLVYYVRDQGIFPYEHTTEPGENIGVYNEIDEEVTLYSDTAENRTVKPGDYTVYSLNRISYFEVNDSEGRVGRLRVNVQRP